MALQLIEIADATVASPQSAVTFSNIPQGYTDLKVVVSARSSDTTGAPWLYFSLNGTGSGFTYRNVNGDGSSVNSGTTVFAVNQSASRTANTFGSADFYLPNYTSSSHKSVSADSTQENNGTTSVMLLGATLWANTAAVTSITFNTDGNFVANSTFTLYGVL
jgi:hypothetical protein